ncbi:hypothetical protein HYPSUDRAFT_66982 [Hypholoma sublateritium FD-334 SS-4]|uniref:Uncharacterized protein n=1 Tax=Hypholoma sublateritium (strain FD-334 SS-4) TaxID=945553 RepID=A0A0D2L6D9_HYPSF|nr:hypothetical protein HYPSUDRAFT_66982 [Hypholoma sublateritium FD-334 SS-4]
MQSMTQIRANHPVLVMARRIQDEHPNLVIYSRLVGGLVEVSWVLKANGMQLQATGLKDWLRARGLFIECLCPLVAEVGDRVAHSCRIVQSAGSRDVFAFCNLDHDGCGMRLNITLAAESATRWSRYSHFGTMRGGLSNDANDIPKQMNIVLNKYRSAQDVANRTVAPHLLGYIGEHVVFYQTGAKQLAGLSHYGEVTAGGGFVARGSGYASRTGTGIESFPSLRYQPYHNERLPKASVPLKYVEIDDFDNPSCTLPTMLDRQSFPASSGPRGASTAITRITKRKATGNNIKNEDEDPSELALGVHDESHPVAGPSRLRHERAISISSTESSTDHVAERNISQLTAGRGLSATQLFGMTSQCEKCKMFFLESAIEAHKVTCVVIEL